MKVVYVNLGHCSTCGRKVTGTVTEGHFLDERGNELDQVHVEGHCGVGGHAYRAGWVTRQEFEEAAPESVLE